MQQRRARLRWWVGLVPVVLVALGSMQAAATAEVAVPQVARDSWKDCAYNDQPIRCRDTPSDDRLLILWIDGIRSSFRRRPSSPAGLTSLWTDRYGGLWRRDLLPQGNTVLTHVGNGNRIMVPLRFPCRPPLKGEVGYCRE